MSHARRRSQRLRRATIPSRLLHTEVRTTMRSEHAVILIKLGGWIFDTPPPASRLQCPRGQTLIIVYPLNYSWCSYGGSRRLLQTGLGSDRCCRIWIPDSATVGSEHEAPTWEPKPNNSTSSSRYIPSHILILGSHMPLPNSYDHRI